MQGVDLATWGYSWNPMQRACGPRRTRPFHVRPVAACCPHPWAPRKVHGNLDFSPRGWGSQGKRSKTGDEKRGQRVRRRNPQFSSVDGPPNRARRADRPSRRQPAARRGRRRALGQPIGGVTKVKHPAPEVQAAATREPARAAQAISLNTVQATDGDPMRPNRIKVRPAPPAHIVPTDSCSYAPDLRPRAPVPTGLSGGGGFGP